MFITDDLLLALVPPVGPQSRLKPLVAFLKLARNSELVVEGSRLSFIDSAGCASSNRQPAFGLTHPARLAGPCAEQLADEGPRPAGAKLARWRLNHLDVQADLEVSEAQSHEPRVIYLPLQVPLATDYHILVSIVNLGPDPINIADGVREAVCWVDGIPYRSVAGQTWNGEYLVRPNRATTQKFRLSDFPGAPRDGSHEVSVTIAGMHSRPTLVTWRGEPWPASG